MQITDITQRLQDAGFSCRPSQQRMIQAVAASIHHRYILLCEGGTGIGKSFGYLLGVLSQAQAKKHTLIIATATIQLMEQLANKDIPQVEKLLGLSLNIEIAKGRRRYICHHKFYALDDLLMLERLTPLHNALEKENWSGDRDSLNVKIDDDLWQKISTDRAGCLNHRCHFFKECAFFSARERQKSADIIITNHATLLADIWLGLGKILPEPEKSTYIIDEAHHLSEQSINSLAQELSLHSSKEYIQETKQLLLKCKPLFDDPPKSFFSAFDLSEQIIDRLTSLKKILQLNFKDRATGKEWVFLDDFPKSLAEEFNHLANLTRTCLTQVSLFSEYFENIHIDSLEKKQQYQSRLEFIINMLETMLTIWQHFPNKEDNQGARQARWITLKQNKEQDDYRFHLSLIDTSHKLAELFWQRAPEAITLCSATLKISGQFQHFARKIGLHLQNSHTVKSISCPSPFAYAQSQLIIPKLKSAPTHTNDQHLQEFQTFLKALLQEFSQGCLVLFTSQKSLENTFAMLPKGLQNKVTCQGDLPKQQLIKKFKHAIDQGKPHALFGLQSLAEGLDLPGHYCKTLIIQKIPFAMPNTPQAQTREHALKLQNKNVFIEHTLPEAHLRLIQWTGRLIRTESDQGKLVLFDDRIIYKTYGKKLLASLPAFEVHHPSSWQETVELVI
ncbi:helicase C-terminal domain-containing protein [Piscirickettsia salmonis]|uniref:helicase C-terminal domain-containing protein n=1 Tax=Piscirickettsia salmonis TaxID=1238 RepID=UPI0037532326